MLVFRSDGFAVPKHAVADADVCCVVEKSAAEKMQPVYEQRRAVVKAIQKFWPVALMNHEMFAIHCQHNLDQVALAYLEDLWVVRDPKEFRAFTIEFVRGFPGILVLSFYTNYFCFFCSFSLLCHFLHFFLNNAVRVRIAL